MKAYRMNITLPAGLAAVLRDKPNKSAYIAEAIREKLDAEERRKRDEELARAYREESAEDLELKEEWDSVSGDGL